MFNSGSFPDFIPFFQNKYAKISLFCNFLHFSEFFAILMRLSVLSLENPLRYEFHIPIVFIIEIDRLVAQ